MIISLSDHVSMCKIQRIVTLSETRKAHLCTYERINKWAAIVKAVCNKRRRDKHCCEKVKQIPYPKFRDRESVKALHNNVDHTRLPSSLQSAFFTHGYEKGYDEPQTISSSRREQVSGKPKTSFHFKVSLLCTL